MRRKEKRHPGLTKMNNPSNSVIKYRDRGPIRWMFKKLINLNLHLLTDFNVIGTENIPASGGLLVVSNHFSFIDPVVLIQIMPRPIEFVGGSDLPNSPVLFKWIPRVWGTYKVHRGGSSRDALTAAQHIITNGGALGIFPEAGSWAKVLRPARPGTALLAARTGAPLLPVGMDGLTEVFPSLRRGKRSKVLIKIGKVFGPFTGEIRGRQDRTLLDDIGHQIMRRISDLIPPERRGYYSDDPKIREAAKGTEIYPWDHVQED